MFFFRRSAMPWCQAAQSHISSPRWQYYATPMRKVDMKHTTLNTWLSKDDGKPIFLHDPRAWETKWKS